MPTMTHPDTGHSFDCPDNQVETWKSAGWKVEPKKRSKSDQAPAAGDNTKE